MPGWVQIHFFLVDHGSWFLDFTKIKHCLNDSWLFVTVNGDVCLTVPVSRVLWRKVTRSSRQSVCKSFVFISLNNILCFFRKCCCMFTCTLQCPSAAAAKSPQSCPTLSDPRDCSLPGSSSVGFSKHEYWSGVPSPSSLVFAFWTKRILHFCFNLLLSAS